MIIKVPAGTVIKEASSGKVFADMSGDNKRQILLPGGKGGNGNQHYATSTMQAPKYAQPGQPAIELELQLELNYSDLPIIPRLTCLCHKKAFTLKNAGTGKTQNKPQRETAWSFQYKRRALQTLGYWS